MENFLTPHMKDSIKNKAVINYPKVWLPTVDTRDIGKSGASCLVAPDMDRHHGKKYEMNGPDLLSSEDIVKVFSKVLGKPIQYQETPRDVLRKVMPEYIAEIMEYMVDNGKQAVPFKQDVKNLTGQNGTFEQFLNDHKDYFN